MDEELVIQPGVGRKKRILSSGKYPIDTFVAALESMLAPAKSYFIRVTFKNGSSQPVASAAMLQSISDVAELAHIFVHATYVDGSTISGRPINSPRRGFLIHDARTSLAKASAFRKWLNPHEIDSSEKARIDGSFAASSLSYQQGQLFYERWLKVESSRRFALLRGFKYTLAFLVAASMLWAVVVGVILVTVFGFQTSSSTETRNDLFPWGLIIMLWSGTCLFTAIFHSERWQKFFATRLYRPRIGPALSKMKDFLLSTIHSAREHTAMIVITSLVTVLDRKSVV